MLNREQILIKASQYFGFDLKKLGIEQTEEKRRFFKRQATNKTIQHKEKKISKKSIYF